MNRLGDEMKVIGSSFTTLHGGMNQGQRDRSMKKFSGGRARVLIATDVASRGIDVSDIGCVINFDPPENGKAYKHRSGRTARAGSTGTVVSLVQRSQQRRYRRIQNEAGIKCKFTDPKVEILEEREFVLLLQLNQKSSFLLIHHSGCFHSFHPRDYCYFVLPLSTVFIKIFYLFMQVYQ